MAKTVKLADIAAIVNVSTVTVSKALSDQKGVSEEMRARIKQLAKEMGYQTPTAARLSSNKRTYNIGVLISEIYFDQTQSFYWQMYQSVATKAVSKECFTLLEVLSMQNEKEMILPKLLQEEKMDGLIIIGMLSSDYLSLIERNIKVPYICLDFYDRKHEFDAVITDNFYGMYKLVNYLFEMGHKKIAYVGTLLSTNSITDRYMGYYKAMLEHGQEVPADYVIDDRSKDTRARRINYDFVLPKDMPTAFACNNDVTAIDLIGYLKQEEHIGEDVYVFRTDMLGDVFHWKGARESSIGEYLQGIQENRTSGQQKKGVTLREVYHQFCQDGTLPWLPEIWVEGELLEVDYGSNE